MTPVIFKFITPQGIPIANHPFYVTLRKAALHKVLTGMVHPEVIAAVTDDQGMATLSLFPAGQPYYVTMDAQADVDGDTCQTAIRFRIAVPDTTTPVYADSLVVQDPIFSQAWDAEAIEVIMLAKAAAIASAAAALESEQHAKASEDAAKTSEINSKASELAASASEVAAKDSQVASAASELNAAGSAAAALVSQNESKFSETNAKTSEINAATSAAAAYQSATAAAASELNAANSSSAALASQNAAAASEASASQSATAASNSSAQAQASEVNAKASELMAQKWAANPEDEGVAGSLYSALHYSMKARDALVAVNTLGEAGALPDIPSNNFIGNHECNVTTDWDAYSAATVITDGEKVTVRKDNPAGSSAGARVALPSFNGAADHILYAKLRTDAGGVLWLLAATGIPTGAIWFEADPSSVPTGNTTPGKVFLQTRSGGASVVTELLYIDAKVNMVEVAVHFDVYQAVVNVWYKIAGSWVFAGSGPYEWAIVAHMGVAMANSMPQNGTVELDYISVCRPNLVVYGDSIGVGFPGWSNDGGVPNYLSHYTAYASFYRGLRNNLPVNKSVGGLSTAGMLNNVANVQNTEAKLVILHASSNDYQAGAGPDFPTRTAQTQQLVDALLSAGAAVVLLNAVPGTPDHPWNKAPSPAGGLRDYTNNWWEQESHKILGLSQRLNIAEVIRGVNGYQDTELTVADGIHLTVEGYRRIGVRMREFYSTGFPREMQKKQDQHRILDQMSKLVPSLGGIPLFVSGDGSMALNASGVFGRVMLTTETEAAGRSALGLGNAATKDVTTSEKDSTPGRILKVGDFGLGNSGAVVDNLNTITATGLYISAGDGIRVVGAPDGSYSGQGYIVHIQHANPDYAQQEFTYLGYAPSGTFHRVKVNGVWNPWTRVLHAGDSFGYGEYMGFTQTPSTAINGLTKSGNYYISAEVQGDLPQQTNGYLEVIGHSSTYALQRFTSTNLTYAWVRRMFNGTWGEWFRDYFGGNTVGTVAGPGYSGAILEYGINSNGRYLRLQDGTQICWVWDKDASSAAAGMIGSFNWTFPMPFVDEGLVVNAVVTPKSNSDYYGVIGTTRDKNSTLIYYRNGNTATQNFWMHATAVGRWK